ncbi:DUF4440 domain-containing protein [Pseudahrensia aquimaris]|uniref:DUF4440 domain-containing protein n=1 Tax=Pseudahrensia aquimaris TaxID=744461 RepID=A0ABW3FAD7_9HYPH
MDKVVENAVLQALKAREPIFHRREFGISREALEAMTDPEFWEVGASGKTYAREYVISNLLHRYQAPEPHDWPCRDFKLRQLAVDLFLLTYVLDEPDRCTRRSTIWKREEDQWKIVFHQGTVVG